MKKGFWPKIKPFSQMCTAVREYVTFKVRWKPLALSHLSEGQWNSRNLDYFRTKTFLHIYNIINPSYFSKFFWRLSKATIFGKIK